MASNPSYSVANGPPKNYVVIPINEDGTFIFVQGVPCNTPDECAKAAEGFGIKGMQSVVFQATKVYGQVTETKVLWQPKGAG